MVIEKFLKKHLDPTKPFLLGLSGGTDSLTLFHLLQGYDFAVAHADHGWRSESAEEAKSLQQLVEGCGKRFHLKTLDPKQLQGNLEAASRKERQQFFKELCAQYKYQAVMLGHHLHDQAETVLKRILEGHPIASLGGMKEVAEIDGVTYWRPLLATPKEAILKCIEDKGLTPFHDATNEDTRFMRANMRARIIPSLSQEYGKEVQEPLIRIAKESELLQTYLEKQISHYPIIDQGIGWALELPPSLHPIELKHLVRKFCRQANLAPSHHQLGAICNCLSKANSSVDIDGKRLYIDRRRLFFPKKEMRPIEKEVRLKKGGATIGSWVIRVTDADQHIEPTGWLDAWKGEAVVTLPKNDYVIGPAKNAPDRVSKWWTNHKVPAFLRPTVPVIWKGEKIHHEFLTGKNKCFDDKPLSLWKVSLSWQG